MVKRHSQNFFSLGATILANLREDLKILLKNASGDRLRAEELTDLIFTKYSEEHRAYHNLSHINALLEHAQNFADKFTDYESVRLAVWFHDVIYDPQSAENEAESAKLAAVKLAKLNFPKATIKRVEAMILATQKHDATALDFDGRLFLDLDLSILGAEREIYKKYARAIRAEYSFAPESLYRYKRRIVLESFLQRELIYHTDEARRLFENQAHLNIKREIKELS